MGGRVIALAAVGIGLIAAAAWAQAGQVVSGPTVYVAHNLRPDAITGFTATCPPGYLALNGGVSKPGTGSTLLSVRPSGARAFIFRFGNPATNDATRVTVAVACRKAQGRPVLKLTPVKTKVVVKPGKSVAGMLACPAQTTPAGAAVDLEPGRARSVGSFAGDALRTRASTASLHGFAFRIASTGGRRARDVVVQGGCVTVLLAHGAPRARLNTTISTFTTAIAPGRQHIVHACPTGWTALGAGYALTSGSARLDGAATLGASGSWWVRNTLGSALKAQLQLICARLS
jgi:hypothetical protein